MMEHIIKIPTERKWFRCPCCGKKLLIYDDTAKCDGVYKIISVDSETGNYGQLYVNDTFLPCQIYETNVLIQ